MEGQDVRPGSPAEEAERQAVGKEALELFRALALRVPLHQDVKPEDAELAHQAEAFFIAAQALFGFGINDTLKDIPEERQLVAVANLWHQIGGGLGILLGQQDGEVFDTCTRAFESGFIDGVEQRRSMPEDAMAH